MVFSKLINKINKNYMYQYFVFKCTYTSDIATKNGGAGGGVDFFRGSDMSQPSSLSKTMLRPSMTNNISKPIFWFTVKNWRQVII